MSRCNSNLPRAIAVADFILENGGHTILEASKEFKLATGTISRDLNYLGAVAFYEYRSNAEELKEKYVEVRKTLARLAKIRCLENATKRRATSK